MKKLLCLLFLAFCAKIGFAQKNFEGEIDYKMFGLSDPKKDTIIGNPQKIFFGKHILVIESLTQKGVVWQENIIFLDSLKEIVIDHRFKEYWEGWRYNPAKPPVNILHPSGASMQRRPKALSTRAPLTGNKLCSSLHHRLNQHNIYQTGEAVIVPCATV